ncbi:MAG TPA: thrombospondin type 3 repeat-containing protein, partial [Conexibacter sp.]
MLRRGALLAAVITLAVPAAAGASLQSAYVFTGNGGYSADGLGTTAETGGTIQAEIPAGSKVERAFLYANNYVSGAAAVTITLDGRQVPTTLLPVTGPSGGLTTSRADVTEQVAAKPAVGSIASFTASYSSTVADGIALVVVFSNPSLPYRRVTLFDGAANPAGDKTGIPLGAGVDPGLPGFAAQLSLGIGFSTGCDVAGNVQFSTVDVNGRRLASCAGGFDDGANADGSLMTVGGVGDSLANPAATDDELYDVGSLISPGDQALTLDSFNQSGNDSLFLAVLQTSVTPPPPPPPPTPTPTPNPPVITASKPRDADGDGIPDSADNCPDKANSDQADGDKDKVGDACEVLPPGDVPPVAGVNAVVKLVSGEVFIKLPAHAPAGLRDLRSPLQERDFVPLKGVASVPVGSQVDARKGSLTIASAGNASSPASKGAVRQQADLRAGMFAIKQARAKKHAKKSARIATDFALVSPPGAEAACAKATAASRPIVVRSLSMALKGVYR